MVASQSPGDPGVAYGPARLQKTYAQLQQNSQGLYHQQAFPASTVSTGSHPSILTCTTNFLTSADCHSSAHIPVQHSSYFGTSVGYSVRQSVNNSGQQREYSQLKFRRRFLKGSSLNRNTGPQQRKPLNCAFSAGTNSAALQGDSLKVAQTVPLKVQHYSKTLQKRCPLLFDLLSENPSDSESFTTKSSSEETNANMALNTVAHVSGKRHYKVQQVDGSLAALNCGQTRTQHLHHSGGTPSTPHQQQVSSPSLNLQSSTGKVLSVGKTKPPTNDEIHAIISKKLAYFSKCLTQKKRSDGHSNKELDMESVQSHLPRTSASKEEDAMVEECSAAVGQYNCLALEEDNSKGNKANAELMPQFNETGDCATSSTEYPHKMLKVAATSTKNEEESPVVLTAVPGMTWDDTREKQSTLVLHRSSSQEEYKSPLLNSNNNLNYIDALNYMTERKKDGALKPVRTVGLDSAQGMVDVAEDPQTKLSPVVSGNRTFGLITQNAKQKKSIQDQQHAREDISSAHSQTNLSIAIPGNKLQKHAPPCESRVEEAHPLYEDVSDDDVLQLATELPTKEHCEFSSPAYFEVPQYEDISEAESQTGSMAEEMTIPTLVAAPNDGQSPFENGGYGHVQGQAVLSDEDTTDNEMDDDYLVIPISIFNLRYEPEDVDQDSPKMSPKRCPSPNLVQATAFPPVLVFDTQESFLLSESIIGALGSSPHEHEMDSEDDVETIQMRRGSDSGETEDSFDYSSASELNYMTVSKKMLKRGLEPVPSKTDDSLSEEESEGNEVSNMEKHQTWALDKVQKPRQSIEAKVCCSKHLRRDDIIIVDSDTEDESDQKCKKRTRRKRFHSSRDSGNAPCSQQKRHSPEILKEKIPKNRPPSVYSPAPLHQSKHDPPLQVVLQDASSDLSKCIEKSGQRVETKAASGHVQHKTNIQKISPEKCVIITDSEDDHAQNYKMPRFPSSRLHKGDAPCIRPKSVDSECGPAEEKLQEARLSLAESPLPQRQFNLRDTQFREATEDACSDLLPNGQLIEARGGAEHVPHNAKRQTTSKRVVMPDSEKVLKGHFNKRKAFKKLIFSSGSEDSDGGNAFASKSRLTVSVDSLCETAKTKLQKNKLSSEDLPEKQPMMKDADSHLPNNFVIPRYFVERSGNKGGLKLLKKSAVHKQGKDGTLSPEASTASSKKTESGEKNKAPLHINKKVKLFTPVPANDKNQATKNNVQDNARKPARVSRQLSLPVQEGPSTSVSSLSSTSRLQAPSRGVYPLEASSHVPYNPRELSFPLNRLRSRSSSLTLNHPPLKGTESIMQFNATGNAKEQVNSYRPSRGDRKLREDNVRPERSRRDRAPRKRHNHPKPATILMKRATKDAKHFTKAIHRVPPKERRDYVGEGYKWSEKPRVAKSTKAVWHCRSQQGGEDG